MVDHILLKLGPLVVVLTVWLTCTPAASGYEYLVERKEAYTLLQMRQYQEAADAFRSLAQSPGLSAVQKSDALEHLCLALIRLKKLEEARQVVADIPDETTAKVCTMQVLVAENKWQGLIDKYGQEPIESWTAYLREAAYLARAMAAAQMGDGNLAAADLEQAVLYIKDTNMLAATWNQLGDVYDRLLKNPDQAIASYRRSQDTGHIFKGTMATMALADLLIRQNQADQALKEIEDWSTRIDTHKLRGAYWGAILQIAHARTLAAAGKREAAATMLQEVLEMDPIHTSLQRQAQEMLSKLSTDQPKS